MGSQPAAEQRALYRKNHAARRATAKRYWKRRFFWARAMKLVGPGRATTQDLAKLWRIQRGRCALTGVRLDRTAQLDHVFPKARGGGDDIGNLRWVTKAVNLCKRDLTDKEFVALCEAVMRWVDREAGV